MVKKSGLTLREIADKCRDYHVRIDQSYISKLQKNNQAPASDEVNIAIAKACGAEPDELLYEAYMIKIPESIKNFFDELIKNIKDIIKFTLTVNNPEFKTIIKQQIDTLSDFKIIKEFLNTNSIFRKNNRALTRKYGYKKLKERFKQIMPGLPMFDDSMAPMIPKDAFIQTSLSSKINSGDIVLVMLTDETYLIRRYVTIDEKIILIADNKKFEPLTIEKESIEFMSKVQSITIPV